MKLVYQRILVLLSVSALCITTTAGFYNHGHPLLVNTKTHSQGPHKLFKRDDDPSQQPHQCADLIIAEACTNGLYQDYASLLERCNEPIEAKSLQDGCTLNSEGKYCGSMDVYETKENIEEICKTPCSPDCKNLLSRTRSELGCCASVYNDSSPAFAYSLWSLCGVEPVTQECSESTVKLSQPPKDPSCNGIWSTTFLRELYSSVICRQKYAQSLNDRLRATEKCKDHMFLTEMIDACRVNKRGAHCGTDLTTFSKATAASGSCHNTAKCDPLCVQALNNVTNTAGCCFNREYNDSTNGRVMFDWMSQEFWSKCGLEPLGFCEVRFTSHAVVLSPSSSGAMILLAVTMLLSML